MLKIVSSYFSERKVTICSKYKIFSSKMEKGCPQGSIVGPLAWNWCMDSLLNRIMVEFAESQIEIIVYADDVVALIKCASRLDIERTVVALMNVIVDWCSMHKLKLAAEKTVAMLVKGRLDRNRSPVVKIYEKKVKFMDETKYLGVILDDRLNFVSYAKYIRNKLVKIVNGD